MGERHRSSFSSTPGAEPPGGRRASRPAAGSSQYAGQHGRDENKKVTGGGGFK